MSSCSVSILYLGFPPTFHPFSYLNLHLCFPCSYYTQCFPFLWQCYYSHQNNMLLNTFPKWAYIQLSIPCCLLLSPVPSVTRWLPKDRSITWCSKPKLDFFLCEKLGSLSNFEVQIRIANLRITGDKPVGVCVSKLFACTQPLREATPNTIPTTEQTSALGIEQKIQLYPWITDWTRIGHFIHWQPVHRLTTLPPKESWPKVVFLQGIWMRNTIIKQVAIGDKGERRWENISKNKIFSQPRKTVEKENTSVIE